MSMIFIKELEQLREMIFRLALSVEDRFVRSITAVRSRDEAMARAVVEADAEIDAQEVRIEEECLKVLALHQPVASDLRFVVFVLKIDNDLERIGDLAVNIAKRVPLLTRTAETEIDLRLSDMADRVCAMLHATLEAFVNMEGKSATAVCAADAEIDALHRTTQKTVYERLGDTQGTDPKALVSLMGISKEIERVGDHVTNMAEDLLYLLRGSIVRHRVFEDETAKQSEPNHL